MYSAGRASRVYSMHKLYLNIAIVKLISHDISITSAKVTSTTLANHTIARYS